MLITLVGVVEFNAGYVGLVHIKPLVDTEHAPEPLLENPKTSQLPSFLHPPGPARSLHWNTTISCRKWDFSMAGSSSHSPAPMEAPCGPLQRQERFFVAASTFPGPLEK